MVNPKQTTAQIRAAINTWSTFGKLVQFKSLWTVDCYNLILPYLKKAADCTQHQCLTQSENNQDYKIHGPLSSACFAATQYNHYDNWAEHWSKYYFRVVRYKFNQFFVGKERCNCPTGNKQLECQNGIDLPAIETKSAHKLSQHQTWELWNHQAVPDKCHTDFLFRKRITLIIVSIPFQTWDFYNRGSSIQVWLWTSIQVWLWTSSSLSCGTSKANHWFDVSQKSPVQARQLSKARKKKMADLNPLTILEEEAADELPSSEGRAVPDLQN